MGLGFSTVSELKTSLHPPTFLWHLPRPKGLCGGNVLCHPRCSAEPPSRCLGFHNLLKANSRVTHTVGGVLL